tara:strand:+ start:6517 stop:7503 length:987 start_codon:yes stop_codon:yes gene_type:complete
MKEVNLFIFSFKMKKYIKYSLYSIILLIVLMFCIDYTLNIIYINTFTGQTGGKINNLIRNYDRVKILAIGDSRCAHHIDPSILGPNNFNLSHNGQSLVFHTGLLDQIINNEDLIIDTILLNLDIEELNYLNRKNEFDIKRLKYYYNKNNWINEQISSLDSKEKYKFLMPIYKWNGVIGSIISNKYFKKEFSSDGYVPTPPSKRDSINVYWRLKGSKYNNFNIENYSVNAKCMLYLKHIQNLCLVKNIKLICFISPNFNHPKTIKSKKDKLYSFFVKNGITLLDYSNEFFFNSELKKVWNWTDPFHLNSNGAKVFTKLIRKDLNKLKRS